MNTASVWYFNYKQIRHEALTSSLFAFYIRQLVSPF
jgi:hypothetical protein